MNDQELDKLISESIARKALMDDINRRVMTHIRQTERSRQIRMWLRIAGFSFGVPAVMLVFFLFTSRAMRTTSLLPQLCVCLSAAALVMALIVRICNFSIRKM